MGHEGGTEKDTARDFRHCNRLSIPTPAVSSIADPILTLAVTASVEEVMDRWKCVAGGTSVDTCMAAVRAWGGPHPAQCYEPYQTPTGDTKYDAYLAALSEGSRRSNYAQMRVCVVTVSIITAFALAKESATSADDKLVTTRKVILDMTDEVTQRNLPRSSKGGCYARVG